MQFTVLSCNGLVILALILIFRKLKIKNQKFFAFVYFFCVKMFKASAHNFKAYDVMQFFHFYETFYYEKI